MTSHTMYGIEAIVLGFIGTNGPGRTRLRRMKEDKQNGAVGADRALLGLVFENRDPDFQSRYTITKQAKEHSSQP